MLLRPALLLAIAMSVIGTAASGQQATPPSKLADDLCSCMGTIDPSSDDRTFNLAVRHCLNTSMVQHSEEVVEILRRFPAQDRKIYLLGLLLGGSLERSCPQYPLVKDRLRSLVPPPPEPGPNT